RLAGQLHPAPARRAQERADRQDLQRWVRAFLTWCARNGVEPALDRPTVDKFVAALLDDGAEPATARFRQLARPGRPRTLAGIKDFHPHVMRHTAADRWLSAGGSEGGLMAIAGW